MSDIPRAREELQRIAQQLRETKQKMLAAKIQAITGLLFRRQPARRMPVKSHPVTPEIKQKIIELAENTELHSSEIAAELGINPGRVSEVLQGDR